MKPFSLLKLCEVIFVAALTTLFTADGIKASTAKNELEEREWIKNQVADLFMEERFEELDAIGDSFLKNGSRTPSGIWKLSLYRTGIGEIANTKHKEELYWGNIENIALKWIEKHPNSPFAHNSYALILRMHGWKYRGGGWARNVKPENWEPFYDYLERAREHLLFNKEIADKEPTFYENMIDIATAESWDMKRFNLLLDEGLTKFPLYYEIYFSALRYLTPKWHGDSDEIEAFAQQAVERTKKKEGIGLYARKYWHASQLEYGDRFFQDSKIIWSQMSKGIDDILADYPDQWNINNFAWFSCLARDRSKAKKLISKIEGPPEMNVWKSDSNYQKYHDWIAFEPAMNLLLNPRADFDSNSWDKYGDAIVEETIHGNKHFIVRNRGAFSQDVALPDGSIGKYALFIGSASSERINIDGAITGLPYLDGYMMESTAPDASRIRSYLAGEWMRFRAKTPNKWVKVWGIFEVPSGTSAIRFSLSQAERKGVPQNGSAARFDDLGLYLVSTEEEAKKHVKAYDVQEP